MLRHKVSPIVIHGTSHSIPFYVQQARLITHRLSWTALFHHDWCEANHARFRKIGNHLLACQKYFSWKYFRIVKLLSRLLFGLLKHLVLLVFKFRLKNCIWALPEQLSELNGYLMISVNNFLKICLLLYCTWKHKTDAEPLDMIIMESC